jgi:hypothetical protein
MIMIILELPRVPVYTNAYDYIDIESSNNFLISDFSKIRIHLQHLYFLSNPAASFSNERGRFAQVHPGSSYSADIYMRQDPIAIASRRELIPLELQTEVIRLSNHCSLGAISLVSRVWRKLAHQFHPPTIYIRSRKQYFDQVIRFKPDEICKDHYGPEFRKAVRTLHFEYQDEIVFPTNNLLRQLVSLIRDDGFCEVAELVVHKGRYRLIPSIAHVPISYSLASITKLVIIGIVDGVTTMDLITIGRTLPNLIDLKIHSGLQFGTPDLGEPATTYPVRVSDLKVLDVGVVTSHVLSLLKTWLVDQKSLHTLRLATPSLLSRPLAGAASIYHLLVSVSPYKLKRTVQEDYKDTDVYILELTAPWRGFRLTAILDALTSELRRFARPPRTTINRLVVNLGFDPVPAVGWKITEPAWGRFWRKIKLLHPKGLLSVEIILRPHVIGRYSLDMAMSEAFRNGATVTLDRDEEDNISPVFIQVDDDDGSGNGLVNDPVNEVIEILSDGGEDADDIIVLYD